MLSKINFVLFKVAILILGYCFYIKTDVYQITHKTEEIRNKIILLVYPNGKNADNFNNFFIAFFIIFGLSIIIDIILLIVEKARDKKWYY